MKKRTKKLFPALREKSDSGFALIIVLWTLVLVALLVAQLNSAGRTEAQLASNLRGAAALQAATDGAIQDAVFHLIDHSPRHWAADNKPHVVTIAGAAVTVRIESQAGKINPNSAPPNLLNQLLRQVSRDPRTAATIAAAIAAWRSPLVPAAEQAAAYRAAGHDYVPPDAPFESLDELGLVLGMTPALLARLTPHLSLYRNGAPDPASADPVVAAALEAWSGQRPTPTSAPPDESLVIISANANGRASRHATIQLTPGAADGPFRFLDWSE